MQHLRKIAWLNSTSAGRHWTVRDTWSELRAWQHGLQYWFFSVTDASVRKLTLLSGRTASSRAHLRSHSGRSRRRVGALPHRTGIHHSTSSLQNIALATANHGRGAMHLWTCRASCPRSRRVKRRATPTERMTARVFREAGVCVRQNVVLRDQGHECERDSPGLEANRSPGSRPSLLWRHSVAQRGLRRRSPPTVSRPRWSGPVAGTPGQGGDTSRTRFFRTVQARHAHHGDGWQVERGGRADPADAPPYVQFSVAGRECWPSRALSPSPPPWEPARNASWCRTDRETPLLAELFEDDTR